MLSIIIRWLAQMLLRMRMREDWMAEYSYYRSGTRSIVRIEAEKEPVVPIGFVHFSTVYRGKTMLYLVTLPIVGYASVEVEASDAKEAIRKALDTDWDQLEIIEEYVTDKVMSGNVSHHPCTEAYAEKQ